MQFPAQVAVRQRLLGNESEFQENLLVFLASWVSVHTLRQRLPLGVNEALLLHWQFFLYTVQETVTSICPKHVQAEEFGDEMENPGNNVFGVFRSKAAVS